MTDLIFHIPQSVPAGDAVRLVFGADDAASVQQVAPLLLDVGLPGVQADMAVAVAVPLLLDAALPGVRTDMALSTGMPVCVDVALPALRADMQVAWDANTFRPVAAQDAVRYQQGMAVQGGVQSAAWMAAAALQAGPESRWQQGSQMQGRGVVRWLSAAGMVAASEVGYEAAVKLDAQTGLWWQAAMQTGHAGAAVWQQAALTGVAEAMRWQSTLQRLRAPVAEWHAAQARQGATGQLVRAARHAGGLCGVQYQQGIPPMPGRSLRPVQAADAMCYVPPDGDAVDLIFRDVWTSSLALLFGCRGESCGRPLVVVVPRKIYMHLTNVSATLWPSGEPVPLFSASLSTDVGGYSWQLDATGPVSLMEQLAPDAQGLRRMLRVEINGVAWIFTIGMRRRSRRWAQQSVSIVGRSVTSLLDAPYQLVRTWSSSSQISAQQIVAAALEGTGATIDWQIDDWVVPGRVWSHRGSPLSVATRVADAVGAVVQSDRTGNTLRFLPRYACMPWEWATTQPAVQLPLGYVMVDGLDEREEVDYNAIYTSGTVAGKLRRTIRAGTAGDVAAQMVTDALLTDTLAHIQRARSELGRGGWQADVSLSCPLDTSAGQPGLLDVGMLLELVDSDGAWRGLVRGVTVAASNASPDVRQTVKVERHFLGAAA